MYGTNCASRANVNRFETYCLHKEKQALAARLYGFRSTFDEASGKKVVPVGNAWSRRLFAGDFYRSLGDSPDTPVVSLVFVQSRSGDTVAPDPSTLGGGETDKHLIYEGLTRVAVDAVMAGAATARSGDLVFSVWHPELVSLRLSLGFARHPAQIVITDSGNVPIEHGLMFEEPTLRVFVVTGSSTASRLRDRVNDRSWVEVIDAGQPLSFKTAMNLLRRRGIAAISGVGGRRTATALLKEGLVSDLYLTTSAIEAGEPNTPYYEGAPLTLSRVLEKAGQGPEADVRFEHLLVSAVPV